MRRYILAGLVAVIFMLTVVPNVWAQTVMEEKTPEEIAEEERLKEERRLLQATMNLDAGKYLLFEQSVYFFENMGEEAVPHLLKEMRENRGDKQLERNILYTLGRLGKDAKRAVPSMIPFLKDEDPDTVMVAVIALGKVGSDAGSAVSELALLLNSQDIFIRQSTEKALRKIGTEQAKTLLGEGESTVDVETDSTD